MKLILKPGPGLTFDCGLRVNFLFSVSTLGVKVRVKGGLTKPFMRMIRTVAGSVLGFIVRLNSRRDIERRDLQNGRPSDCVVNG